MIKKCVVKICVLHNDIIVQECDATGVSCLFYSSVHKKIPHRNEGSLTLKTTNMKNNSTIT